jgi:hypothetical protein
VTDLFPEGKIENSQKTIYPIADGIKQIQHNSSILQASVGIAEIIDATHSLARM